MITIRGAVVTGFEFAACEEVNERFGVHATSSRGAIVFDLPNAPALSEILTLRSVDSLYAVIDRRRFEAICDKDQDTALQSITALLVDLDWASGLQALENVTQQSLPGGHQRAIDALNAYRTTSAKYSGDKNGLPSYRVSCYRPGPRELHSFGSMDAARALGNVINNCFGWPPKMDDFDIEVVLRINNSDISVELALTKKSLHCRNIVEFGRTTLRSTICHGLLRMAAPRPGETIVDPLCGSGSIPLEAATGWSELFVLGGDNYSVALERSAANLQAIYSSQTRPSSSVCSDEQTSSPYCSFDEPSSIATNQAKTSPTSQLRSPVAFVQWDSTKLPLGNESVDCIVTDLPFGKRLRTDNRRLYPALLLEWARVLKKDGRVAALTHDRRNMSTILMRCKPIGRLWNIKATHNINVGGLICIAYLLTKR
uniref:UPF0020 domain-containing protein n=1 Tax=Plectus sambesii TaxID=2011161 RepID=A0A914W994_9BILA